MRHAYYLARKDDWVAYRKLHRKRIREMARPKDREYGLKGRYGMTLKEWDILFESQGKICAACGVSDPSGYGGNWHTDHCHVTGVVRGILCGSCNVILGHAKDSIERLLALGMYLERTNARAKGRSVFGDAARVG
jgi:hypothetical protein